MRKVEEQRKLLIQMDPPLSTYIKTFSQVYRLPCLYTLNTLAGSPLLLSHFYTHWHLQREGNPQFFLKPRQLIEPVRVQSSLPRSSTRREPSQFEAVEAQAQPRARAPSQCTKCGAVGHIRTSRACPLRYSDVI